MHELGYKYTGPGNLYQLTWIEIFNLVESAVMISDEASGVRQSDLEKFQKYNERLALKGNT